MASGHRTKAIKRMLRCGYRLQVRTPDALVLCSRRAKMACGIPIVAYDIEWMSEVVIDGYFGYTADFLDTAGMARRCLALLNDRSAASELGSRAQVLARKLFDRSAIIERENDYLRKAREVVK
jgi:glycosyltransferase involved in cell wall biosynthesis